MYFFIADEHYGHSNIIKYRNRPFKNVTEMDEIMVANHNNVVGKNDVVIHAGDFCWFKQYYKKDSNDDALSYINRLNGSHVFLEGDHDKWMRGDNRKQQIWRKMIEKNYIVICHYALHSWPRSHYNSWHLYGHSHVDMNLPGKRHCISVENTNYYPLSFDQIKEIMKNKPDNPNFIKPEDRRR